MKKILVIDNYDSFTYNLAHYLEALDCEVTVCRNDEFDIGDAVGFDKILISPGPGIPEDAGLTKDLIREYSKTKSILGICLGQQAIAEVFGGSLINLPQVYHGIEATIRVAVADEILYHGMPETLTVGRYHSWSVAKDLPACLEATSFDENGEIMSLSHRGLDVRGVQFHPESVLTPFGKMMLKNWIGS